MQAEIDAAGPARDVHILGVNLQGLESGNPDMVTGRTLPWLQDRADVDAWSLWGARWRDVYVLDEDNVVLTVYNVSDHDLQDPANYAALKTVLLDAAGP